MTKKEREEKLKQRLAEMKTFEKGKYEEGAEFIAGVDEVGRGPLAGPVCAACVVLPQQWDIPGLDDSKKLSEKRRNEMYQIILEHALAIGISMVDNQVIDEINILQATKRAMKEAVVSCEEQLGEKISHIFVDAVTIDGIDHPQTAIIKGDAKSVSIAAASIIAKVTRDEWMKNAAEQYPYYDWESNKGYGTKAHYEGIKAHGICELHRKSFLKNIL